MEGLTLELSFESGQIGATVGHRKAGLDGRVTLSGKEDRGPAIGDLKSRFRTFWRRRRPGRTTRSRNSVRDGLAAVSTSTRRRARTSGAVVASWVWGRGGMMSNIVSHRLLGVGIRC